MKLDISMRTISTPTTSVFTGSFPVEYTEETLRAKIAEGAPDVDGVVVEILSASPQQTCAFLMCHISQGLKLETYLRSIGFTYPAEPSKVPPAERVDILNGRIAALQKEIDKNEAEIRTHKNRREDLLYTIDYFTMRTEKYDVLGRLWQSPHVFLITGYIPAENAEALKTELTTTQEAYVELCDPSDADDVPVKLKNNKFAAPVEGVLESYSMPGKHEIDPSGIMAVFYYFLFGMMLSDAGYGLVMVLGCGIILHKFKNMEEGLRKTLTMFLYCGISTIFWGILFGSFFGDAITVIAKTFFNTDIVIPPLWFTPVDEPMRLLLFSFLVGIIHLFAGLGAQFYQLAKQGKWLDAIYDVVLVSARRRRDYLSAFHADVRRHGGAFLYAAGIGGHRGHYCGRHRRGRHCAHFGPQLQEHRQALLKRSLRAVRCFELFKRHSLLLETFGSRPCNRRYRFGLQPDGRHARQQPARRDYLYFRLCSGTHAEYRHQCARRVCAHKPLTVC